MPHYVAPTVTELGSLAELTLHKVEVSKIGRASDVITAMGGGQGVITSVTIIS